MLRKISFVRLGMEKAKKLFGGIRMTWPHVLALAVVTAAYTALINQVGFLEDTSFRDIAVTLECWFLFAVFIIVNCEKWWEASLKCFVFFLISQPLIYLIEVPFFDRGWEIFQYYRYWFIMTLLTLPGAAIAFFVKKKNWLSVLILSVATGYLALQAVTYFQSALRRFPHHLLSSLFCIALALFFIFVLLESRKHRAAALAIFCAALIVSPVITFTAKQIQTTVIYLGDGAWQYELADETVAEIQITDNCRAVVSAGEAGETTVSFTDENGTVCTYSVVSDGSSVTIDAIE